MTSSNEPLDPSRRTLMAGAVGFAALESLPQINVGSLKAAEQQPEALNSLAVIESHAIAHADLNGDGENELLVAFCSGLYNACLHVYGRTNNWSFGLLAELPSTTFTDFDLEDVDGDGVLEVVTIEVSEAAGAPYVMGMRDRVAFKLVEGKFKEIRRDCCHTAEEIAEVRAQMASNFA